LANQRNAERRRAYQDWIQSHTPDQIRIANSVRSRLRHKDPKNYNGKWVPLQDDRLVAEPRGPYVYFTIDRHSSGDLKHIPISEAGKLIANEWKALGASEKQVSNLGKTCYRSKANTDIDLLR